jgi:hypothetical protein
VKAQVRKSVVAIGRYHLPSKGILLPAEGRSAGGQDERRVATMITNTFGAGVAAAVLTAATFHAARTAAPAAAVKHRAAATDASVDRGHT